MRDRRGGPGRGRRRGLVGDHPVVGVVVQGVGVRGDGPLQALLVAASLAEA
ncbi:hypothetical protein [Streptomyces vinaceus]|uniref:hypothetical protein n=1 Tax=Streptomyces vinaceus TaxID=1960 RepID=UPI0035D7ECD3